MKTLYTHPINPQQRHIAELATVLKNGDIAIVPTEIGYQPIITLSNKTAFERLSKLGYLNAVLLCHTLSDFGRFGVLDTTHFRTLNSLKKSDNIFILPSTKDTPKHLTPKKTIALRLSHTPMTHALFEILGEPMVAFELTQTLASYEIETSLDHLAALFINVGDIDSLKPSILDLTQTPAVLIEKGDSDVSAFF